MGNSARTLQINLSLLLLMPFMFILGSEVRAENDPFPVFPVIESNVAFWKKVYSEYTTEEGIIHDADDLNLIYRVIPLEKPDTPGSRKINHQRTKTAKREIKTILKQLAMGAEPETLEEKRITTMFGPGATAPDYKRAAFNLRCQVGQKDRFREGLIRSGAYLDQIKKIFREHGLPEDLAYLPHVESSFNPKAYSKFGAAGIWQFTRSTGRMYMTVGYAVDERRDPIFSTYAAARFLMKNHQKLQNWPMAITAYNHGTSGMMRAEQARGTYPEIFKSYRSRLFKFASRNFYSEFLAAREVAQNYQLYFGELDLEDPLETTEIRLNGYTSMPVLADLLDIEVDELSRLNPALRKPVISGQKYIPPNHRLRLPAEEERDWEALIEESAPQIYRSNQKHSRFYTVSRGDTAGKIAARHGIDLQGLIAANNLDSRATIYVNQNLVIPLPEETSWGSPATASVAAADQTAPVETPQEKFEPEPQELIASVVETEAAETDISPQASPPAMVPSPQAPTHEQVEDTPEPGEPRADFSDSWLSRYIARENEPQPPEIEPLTPQTLVNPQIVTGEMKVESLARLKNRTIGIIRVEVEETIGHYAEWLDVRAQDIRLLNGFGYGRVIHLGQRVKIPLHRVSREEFEEKRFEYHKEMVEDFFAAYRVEGVQSYSIKRGDNIWDLATEEFELPLWLIRKYNEQVDFNRLMPSQELMIPVVEKMI